MLNIILGMFILIFEFIKDIFILLFSIISLTYSKNKNNNRFINLITKRCYFIYMIVNIIILLIFSQIDFLLAYAISFVWIFYYAFIVSKKGYKIDEPFIFGYVTSILIYSFVVIYSISSTPKIYKEINTFEVIKENLTYNDKTPRTYFTFRINNKKYDIKIGDCNKAGTYKIYKENLDFSLIKNNLTKYQIECNNEFKILQNLGK